MKMKKQEDKMKAFKEALEEISKQCDTETKLLMVSTAYWLQLAFDDMVMESFDDYYQGE